MTESGEQTVGKAPPSGKKRRWLWVLGGVAAVMAAYVGWNIFDSYVLLGESTITISPETTYITEPLNPDGTVNYVQALVDRYSEGVTPENNAMTLLAQAFGPEFLPEATRLEILRQLGLSEEDLAAGKKFVRWSDYLEAAGLDEEEVDPDYDLLERLGRRPWAAEDHPEAAAWLAENAEPLALIRQASMRPRNYFPIVSMGSPPSVISLELPISAHYRNAAWALSARATLHLASGDIPEAWADSQAIHVLAGTPYPYAIWHLTNVGMLKTAANAEQAIVSSGRLLPEMMRGMLADIKGRPPTTKFADVIENDLMLSLDCAMMLYRVADATDLGLAGQAASHVGRGMVDWDALLRRVGAHHRQMMRAVSEMTCSEYRAWESRRCDELEHEMMRETKRLKILLTFHSLTQNRRAVRNIVTRTVGNSILSMLIPDFAKLYSLHVEAGTRRDLVLLALAAKLYKAERGDWPGELADLVPEYLDAVPQDRFTDQPLVYERAEGGMRIYSLGPNMADDGRLNIEDADDDATDYPDEADDIAIELP